MPVANAEILLRIAECANRELTTVALPVSITAMVINWDHTPSHAGVQLDNSDKSRFDCRCGQGRRAAAKKAAVIVECILDRMVKAIEPGDKIEIRGFGTFRTRQRQGRTGRNTRTGARVEVPAKRIPFFKPARNCATR